MHGIIRETCKTCGDSKQSFSRANPEGSIVTPDLTARRRKGGSFGAGTPPTQLPPPTRFLEGHVTLRRSVRGSAGSPPPPRLRRSDSMPSCSCRRPPALLDRAALGS